jgi:hypothetical protein
MDNKQIEEMAEIICENYNDGRCLVDGFNCMEGTCKRREHIEKLISAGYRKERQGEWKLEHETYGKMMCSVCGKRCPTERKPDPYEDYQMTDFYIASPFCPNCGAKMKGE